MNFEIIDEIVHVEIIGPADRSETGQGSRKLMARAGGGNSKGLPTCGFKTAGFG